MLEILGSETVSDEIPPQHRIYEWLIGSWDVVAKDYDDKGGFTETPGEWHFYRVLEGRAVQDVWICPVRAQRYPGMPKTANRYGTSIRFYHPMEKAWQVVWINPVSGSVNKLDAKKVGRDIVQVGTDDDGHAFRWIFTEITDESCRWYGERSYDGEKSWNLEVEFFMKKKERRLGPTAVSGQ